MNFVLLHIELWCFSVGSFVSPSVVVVVL